jgi:hypothetical protein
VRLVVRQRRGQQPGQCPRPASRRARDRVQPGRGIPQRRRGIPDIVLGGRRELREAAEPVQFAAIGRHPDPGRGPPRGGQVSGSPAERLQAGPGPLVAGILEEDEQGWQTL